MQSAKQRFSIKDDERGKNLSQWKSHTLTFRKNSPVLVIQKLSERKGELQGMSTASDGSTRLEFEIPSRGLIGFRGEFMTSTKGTGILNTILTVMLHTREIEYRTNRVP